MTELARLEKRVTELEETVKRLSVNAHNTRQDVRYHDEALTTLFAKPARKTSEAKAEYKT